MYLFFVYQFVDTAEKSYTNWWWDQEIKKLIKFELFAYNIINFMI